MTVPLTFPMDAQNYYTMNHNQIDSSSYGNTPALLDDLNIKKSSPALSKNPSSWDPSDDLLLRHLKEVKKMGWKEIAQYFENRTPNACQFRWRRLKSGNLKSNTTALMDVTQFPGQIKILNKNPSIKECRKVKSQNNQNQKPIVTDLDSVSTFIRPAPVTSNSFPTNIQPLPNPQQFRTSSSSSSPPASSSMLPIVPIDNDSKFIKPRSYSHSFTNNVQPLSTNPSSISNLINSTQETTENVGFVPKVFVRSRRNSFAFPTNNNAAAAAAAYSTSPTSPLQNALNTTLNGSKSRKNSFANWSRRSSFTVGSSGLPTRRSSTIVAPNSVSNSFNFNSPASNQQRRGSLIKKELINQKKSSMFTNSYKFTDIPLAQSIQRSNTTPLVEEQKYEPWTNEEDQLLLENRSRNLNKLELSILLANRSEREIEYRLNCISNRESLLEDSSKSSSVTSLSCPPPSIIIEGYSSSPTHSSKRKSISINEIVFDDDDDEIDPLHVKKSNERCGSEEANSTTSNNSSMSTAATLVNGMNQKELLNDLESAGSLRSQSLTPNANAPQLPSIGSLFKTMV
ncbi:hypothetical protein KAFR_0K01720 [Kazachstania africana CBS 2517]|uniref:Myb-like domain-containing protein n=1 Tax=Kazachstania africana (strain ATCC 22294 / BCRC 22015 / CBS 2517 / CECT 1963 / NBRC 1671 / NRRL Y-8276) TaxID=1071382 RepID=H2B1M6_KAZAF|nr:hypothetical protein KAFR_0K01720 [Kazachstania africana CBS 2517]CCF60526.1 hypothetical protein KAFR_0K01720 [Kazachstania africana CBS 2517]